MTGLILKEIYFTFRPIPPAVLDVVYSIAELAGSWILALKQNLCLSIRFSFYLFLAYSFCPARKFSFIFVSNLNI